MIKYVKKESVDLAITSPPYWNILNQKRTADFKEIRTYSKSKKDLGNIEDYEKFLESLKQVFSKVYDSLKFNKRCISVVMDIRKKDKFFPLHEDQTRIMKEIGFELEEYVIWDVGDDSGLASIKETIDYAIEDYEDGERLLSYGDIPSTQDQTDLEQYTP